MDESVVKVCPDCGSEYQLWVERCRDCGAALVSALEADVREVEPPAQESPLPADRVLLRTASDYWIRSLSKDLELAGIAHWVEPLDRHWRTYDSSLFVLPSDLAEARRIDAIRYRQEVPEAGGEEAPVAPARERREPSPEDLSIKLCPRCGGEYQVWVERCVDCDVPLVHPWDFEAARQAEAVRARPEVPEPEGSAELSDACPACGERLREGDVECRSCGLVLAPPSACPSCGAELDTPVLTCPRCGESLYASTESEE